MEKLSVEELENEKKDREASEENVMGLLEDTCNKFHQIMDD